MRPSALLPVLLGCSLLLLTGCEERICDPGITQTCVCPGALDGAQACTPSGTSWGDCECPADDDDATADDDDSASDDDDTGPDDDDSQPPDDDDTQPPDDDDTQPPDDDDTQPPDDDDTQPPDDDDFGPPDDDDFGPPDDDDSGGPPNDGPTPCPGLDQSICDNSAICPFALGCSCISLPMLGGDVCLPNCNVPADCTALGNLQCVDNVCQPVGP